jgi:hypothetical protein
VYLPPAGHVSGVIVQAVVKYRMVFTNFDLKTSTGTLTKAEQLTLGAPKAYILNVGPGLYTTKPSEDDRDQQTYVLFGAKTLSPKKEFLTLNKEQLLSQALELNKEFQDRFFEVALLNQTEFSKNLSLEALATIRHLPIVKAESMACTPISDRAECEVIFRFSDVIEILDPIKKTYPTILLQKQQNAEQT